MRWIFDIENPVMQYIIKIFDCMCLSIIWLLLCIPVITAGASTTAMYETMHRYIRKDEGTLWRTFWGAFRTNFKRSTRVWLVALVVAALLAADVLVFRTLAINGHLLGQLYLLILVLCCVAVTWMVYLFAYAARFHGSARDVLRISLLLLVAHPLKALAVFVLVAVGILLGIMAPGLLTILPAGVCLLTGMILDGVFTMHLPQQEND